MKKINRLFLMNTPNDDYRWFSLTLDTYSTNTTRVRRGYISLMDYKVCESQLDLAIRERFVQYEKDLQKLIEEYYEYCL